MVRSRPAFTLIETLIATAIALLLLGSSLFASRTISAGTAQLTEQAQMGALADEAIANLKLAQIESPTTSLSSLVGLSGSTTKTSGGFYCATCTALGTGDPANRSASGLSLRWGSLTVLNSAVTAPVQENGVRPLFSASFTNLIAVSRDLADLKSTHQLSLDLTAISGATTVNADDFSSATKDASHWTTYELSTTVVQASDTTSGWTFSNDKGSAVGAAAGGLKTGSYLVTVTVSNYHNPGSQLVRQAYLTDWTN